METGTETLIAEVDEGLCTITMNRPEARNAASEEMKEGLQVALAEAERSSDVRAVLLTGAGAAFCAGGDLNDLDGGKDLTHDELLHQERRAMRATVGALFNMPKPTIAAIGGPAAGAGLSFALACDLRIGVESTFLTTAFARVGFSGDYGASWFMTRLIGEARTKELFYLSERIDMVTAERLGLVNWVVAPDRFEAETQAIARRLASGPSVAFGYMKENINRALDQGLLESIDVEMAHHLRCRSTEDHIDAAQAFLEKREPVFRGR